MATVKLPYVKWRDGRPRAVHGPRERAAGFKDVDLRHDDGRWFTLDEARAWSAAHALELATQRASGKRMRRPPPARGNAISDLLTAFFASADFLRPRAEGGYADKTRKDYTEKADAILYERRSIADRRAGIARQPTAFSLAPVTAIEPPEVKDLYLKLERERGRTMARGAVMVLSAAWKWGTLDKLWRLKTNPCNKLGLAQPGKRVVVWEIEEVRAFIAGADANGEHALADAVVIALFSGQRESDVLAIDGVHPLGGVIRLVQSKRHAHIEVPHIPPLAARLEAIAQRRTERGYNCDALIVDPVTGKGFNQSSFQHRFADLRRVVSKDCASIAGKTFSDLRDTLVTWLKRAGARDDELAAVTGHSLASLHQVLPHYFAPGAEEAKGAMAKLVTWMDAKGMAV